MKTNLRYKHDCLTKIALITTRWSLIFVALAVILTNYSFGNPAPDGVFYTGNNLSGGISTVVSANDESKSLGIASGRNRDLTLREGNHSPAQNSACPQSVAPPSEAAYPKESVAEIYVRLIEEHVPPFREPPCLPGNTQQARNQELWGEKH